MVTDLQLYLLPDCMELLYPVPMVRTLNEKCI